MTLLFSSIRPIQISGTKTYGNAFVDLLAESDEAVLVVAYIATDALTELQRMLEITNPSIKLTLVVGMAKFDGLTLSQLRSLQSLNDFLSSTGRGEVRVVGSLPMHAKVSVFVKSGKFFGGIVGSSNLSGLSGSFRQYEVDCLLRDPEELERLSSFCSEVKLKYSVPLEEAKQFIKIVETPNVLLDGITGVSRVDVSQIETRLTTISFELPAKTEPKSNLNIFFGAPRTSNGRSIPRPWYEVELIVGKEITKSEHYPKAETSTAEFDVITDDGWRIPCMVQGQNSKNFRSRSDLKTLGKWIKGRMEAQGALKPGDLVDQATLSSYGRRSLTFTKLDEDNLWFLDYSSNGA